MDGESSGIGRQMKIPNSKFQMLKQCSTSNNEQVVATMATLAMCPWVNFYVIPLPLI